MSAFARAAHALQGDSRLSSSAVLVVARLGGLLAIYLALDWWTLGVARLSEAAYHQPSILLGLVQSVVIPHGVSLPALLRLGILGSLALVLLRYRTELTVPWSRLTGGPYLRIFVVSIVVILGWTYSTYDYNLYYDHSHWVDRTLLLGLAALTVWRPLAALPFTLLFVAIIWQFQHPLGHFSVAEQFVLMRMLLLFTGSLLLRAIFRRSWSAEFLYLSVAVLGSAYLQCGLGKALLDWSTHGPLNWLTHGHIHFLTFATYGNGWLGFLDIASIQALTRMVSRFDPLMVGGTILLECGAIFALCHRRILLGFLMGWIVFHLSVFALSGICFWKWMLVEAVLIAIFLSRGGARAFPIFSRDYVLLSLPLIVVGTVLFRPVTLAWYDTPVSYTYRFVGTGASGQTYSLSPQFFAPYDYQFTMGNFHYLSEGPDFDITWGGIWSRDTVDRLLQANSTAEVEELERERGRVHLDPEDAARMDQFLQNFLGTFERRGSKRTPFSIAKAPPQLWTFPRPDAFDGQEPLERVTVYQMTSFFDGMQYHEFRERELRTVAP